MLLQVLNSNSISLLFKILITKITICFNLKN